MRFIYYLLFIIISISSCSKKENTEKDSIFFEKKKNSIEREEAFNLNYRGVYSYEILGRKHNSALRKLIDGLASDKDEVSSRDITKVLRLNWPEINTDSVYMDIKNNYNLLTTRVEFRDFVNQNINSQKGRNIVNNINLMISHPNLQLKDLLNKIERSKTILQKEGGKLNLRDAFVIKNYLSVCKFSGIFWAPKSQGGLGFYDYLENKLEGNLSVNLLRNEDELDCDSPCLYCCCGAADSEGAATCICCESGDTGGDSGNDGWNPATDPGDIWPDDVWDDIDHDPSLDPGFWSGALKGDAQAALGATVVLGWGSGTGALITTASAAVILEPIAIGIAGASLINGLIELGRANNLP